MHHSVAAQLPAGFFIYGVFRVLLTTADKPRFISFIAFFVYFFSHAHLSLFSCGEFLPRIVVDAVSAGAGVKTAVRFAKVGTPRRQQPSAAAETGNGKNRPRKYAVHSSFLLHMVCVRLADIAPKCFDVAGMRPAFGLRSVLKRAAFWTTENSHLRHDSARVVCHALDVVVVSHRLDSS